MTEVLLYECPSYTASCSVALELAGPNFVRPSCGQEIFAKILESSQNSPHCISQIGFS